MNQKRTTHDSAQMLQYLEHMELTPESLEKRHAQQLDMLHKESPLVGEGVPDYVSQRAESQTGGRERQGAEAKGMTYGLKRQQCLSMGLGQKLGHRFFQAPCQRE